MKNDEQDSRVDDRQWAIDRYVLEDPSLDREQFEAQMLEDPSLALAVAETVGQMQAWAEMLVLPERATPPAIRSQSASGWATEFAASGRTARWLASAALVMLALGVGLSGILSWQRRAWQPADAALDARIVDSWLALEGEPADALDADENAYATDYTGLEYLSSEDGDTLSQNATRTSESERRASSFLDEPQEDWLVEAAREFYSHQVSGFSSQGS